MNELKTVINRLIVVKKTELLKSEENDDYYDSTLPGRKYPKGSLHLVTYAIEEISKIFAKIGFIIEKTVQLSKEELKDFQTNWAKRLSFGKERPIYQMIFKK